MENRLIILKSNWGIVIIYDFEIMEEFEVNSKDVYHLGKKIYIKVDKQSFDSKSFHFFIEGVKKVLPLIREDGVCFHVKKIEYNYAHYQPEAMYYVFKKWYCESQGIKMEPINVSYDKEKNRYIFPDLMEIEKKWEQENPAI